MAFNWKKIKDAQLSGKGRYLMDGAYKLIIQKMFTIKTRGKGLALIVDFIVHESNNPNVKEGEKRNWYQSLQDEDIAMPAIKEFMMAVYDVDPGDPEELADFEGALEELMEECAGDDWRNKHAEDHPLFEKTVAVECFTKKTRTEKDFTVHNWMPWEGPGD